MIAPAFCGLKGNLWNLVEGLGGASGYQSRFVLLPITHGNTAREFVPHIAEALGTQLAATAPHVIPVKTESRTGPPIETFGGDGLPALVCKTWLGEPGNVFSGEDLAWPFPFLTAKDSPCQISAQKSHQGQPRVLARRLGRGARRRPLDAKGNFSGCRIESTAKSTSR